MRHLLFSILFFLFYTTFCSVFAQKVAEYTWGERRYSNLQWVWEMPDGQLAAIGSRLKNQDTLTEFKLLHMTTGGTVTAETFLSKGCSNVVPSPDGTTFFSDAGFSQQGRHVRYLVSSSTGKLLDSSVFANAALIHGYGMTSRGHPDGGRVLIYGTKLGLEGQIHIVRMAPSGNVLFDKTVSTGFSPAVLPSSLMVLPSGRICITHTTLNGEDELLCYNPEGFLLWKRKLPLEGLLSYPSFIVDLGNNRVAFVAAQSLNSTDSYVLSVTASGAMAWERTSWGQEAPEFEITNCFNDNGNLVLSGEYRKPGELGMSVVKLGPDGKTIYAQQYPALSSSFMVSKMLSNGNYLFSGFRWKPIPGGFQSDKAYFLSLSPDGNARWLLANDSLKVGNVTHCWEMKDRGIALVGYGSDGFPGAQSGTQGLVFYLSPTVPTISPVTAQSSIEAFPNPAMEGAVWLRSKDADQAIQQVQVFAADGREVGRYQPGETLFQLQLPAERGAYWLKVQTDRGGSEVLRVLRQ